MVRYRVLPSGTHWRVTKYGTTMPPNHRKKSAAVDHAKQLAGPGDSVEIRRQDGSVQEVLSY